MKDQLAILNPAGSALRKTPKKGNRGLKRGQALPIAITDSPARQRRDHQVVSTPSKSMLLPVPFKMLRIRAEAGIFVEVQWLLEKKREESSVGR